MGSWKIHTFCVVIMVSGFFVCRYNFLLLAEKLPVSSNSCPRLTNLYLFQLGNTSFSPSHSTTNPRRSLLPLWNPSMGMETETQSFYTFLLLDGGCSLVKNNPFPSSLTTAFCQVQTLLLSALLTACSRIRGQTFLARQEFTFCVSESCASLHKL